MEEITVLVNNGGKSVPPLSNDTFRHTEQIWYLDYYDDKGFSKKLATCLVPCDLFP